MAIATSQVFFDISADGAPCGTIIMELYGGDVRSTAENFRALCTGQVNGLTYKGSDFFRIIPKFCLRGGDIVNNDGTGNKSIYGGLFEDENFKLKHSDAGTLTMFNTGKNTNGSQFLITTVATSWLDGKNVAFGKVVKGMEVLNYIETLALPNERPSKKIVIYNCGELKIC